MSQVCNVLLEPCDDPTGASCWKKRAKEAEAALKRIYEGDCRVHKCGPRNRTIERIIKRMERTHA